MPVPFHTGSVSHLTVLLLTLVIGVALVVYRRRRPTTDGIAEKVLMWLLVASWPATLFQHWQHGTLDASNALPMHFCDWALIGSIMALATRRPLAVEVSYFFGLAGTLQGLLTPSLIHDWPHPAFVAFFLVHSGIVVTAIHLVAGLRLLPRPGSVKRMIGMTLLYACLAGIVNLLLGTNYGFLCAKPPTGSLLDVLGPWPWYIGSLLILATLLYSLLVLPIIWSSSNSSPSQNLA